MKITLAVLVFLCLALDVDARASINRARHRRQPTVAAQIAGQTPAGKSSAQTLPIRRVILYSNGVAYIERRGTVRGHAEVNLSFKESEVDDILKSMVVLDLGRGRIGAVSYNSSAPPSARMAEISFAIGAETKSEAGGGLAGVLSQMQGARLQVTTARGNAVGSLLTVEAKKMKSDAGEAPTTTHAVVIAGADGELMSFDLAEVRSVKLLDEGARRDVRDFAGASASARRRDAKTITVTSDGDQTREMLISYTVASPIWKTTYRVVLDAEGKPFFQGWAIVDNVSEEDWNAVELSLISGTPVSFIQPIQKPFYRYRPVVPMPGDLRLSPQIYEPSVGEAQGVGDFVSGTVQDSAGAVVPGASVTVINESNDQQVSLTTDNEGRFRTQMLAAGAYRVMVDRPGFKRFVMDGISVGAGRPAVVRLELEVGTVSETVTVASSAPSALQVNSINNLALSARGAVGGSQLASVGAALAGGASGVETAAEGSEVGDLFEYKIDRPVTIERDHSALIPIVQTKLDGERVSIYNENSRQARPMSGLLMRNTSSLTLESGALTVIDGNAYAGETLMDRLKPAEQRLISFALDLGTLVSVRGEENRGPVFSVKIVNGSMLTSYHNRETKVYRLVNQTDRARTVYVEHPVRDDWELDEKATVKPDGRSDRYYRFRIALAARASVELPITERETSSESYALNNISSDVLQVFVAQRFIDEQTRVVLQNVIDLKARIAASNAVIVAFDKELNEISEDQKRLRENIGALTNTAEAKQLIVRYVAKADQQESRIEELTKEKQKAVEERQRMQSQLNSTLRDLSFDRKTS